MGTHPVPALAQLRAVPNLLTLLRMFLIPFIVIEVLDGQWHGAFLLFVLAGVSDGLDGLLARQLDQHTRLGQYLDPIADKMMLSTLFLLLTREGLIPRYVAVLVFSRDLGILLIATVLFVTNTLRNFQPSLFGKLNTVAQIAAVVVIFSRKSLGWTSAGIADEGLLRVIAVLAPLSAAQYAWLVVQRVGREQAAA